MKLSKAEAVSLNDELMDLIAKEAESGKAIGDLATTDSLLRDLREKIEWDLDWDTRRAVVEGLVAGITVDTKGTGRKKTAVITVSYNFSEPVHVVNNATSCLWM